MAAESERGIGVYIDSHGIFDVDSAGRINIVYPPTGMIINKQNIGGFGCPSYKIPISGDPHEFATSLETILFPYNEVEYCKVSHGLYDSHGNKIDKTNSCDRFMGNPKWVKKIFKHDDKLKNMIISFNGKTINLWDAISREDLIFFLGIPIIDQSEKGVPYIKIDQDLDDLLNAFMKQKRNFITTEDLFNIFSIIQMFHGINTVNIFDASCNVVLEDRERVTYRTNKDGTRVDDKGSLKFHPKQREQLPPLDSVTGYGGTTRKKIKRKSKRRKY